MDHRRTHLQQTAAAKAGISERSARRIDRDPILLSQRKRPRIYRTRVNPFEDVWEAEIVPLLRAMPSLQAITILRELQRRHPGVSGRPAADLAASYPAVERALRARSRRHLSPGASAWCAGLVGFYRCQRAWRDA